MRYSEKDFCKIHILEVISLFDSPPMTNISIFFQNPFPYTSFSTVGVRYLFTKVPLHPHPVFNNLASFVIPTRSIVHRFVLHGHWKKGFIGLIYFYVDTALYRNTTKRGIHVLLLMVTERLSNLWMVIIIRHVEETKKREWGSFKLLSTLYSYC